MPIYEYYCIDCNQKFEYLTLKNDEKIYCPNCKSENNSRIMSSFAHKIANGKMISSKSSCSSCSSGGSSSCSTCS